MASFPRVVDLSIAEILRGYQSQQFSCTDLVQTYILRIKQVNVSCHAVIEVNPDALSLAHACDEVRAAGNWKGRLHGVPILVKDIFHTNDKLETTAGSLVLLGTRLGNEATLIRRLRQEGAIILGTTNLTEWANFRSGPAPNGWSARGGQCYGPYCDSQDPGGSSSGSAVAARLGLAAACIGAENNGSITVPASKAAVFGLKPTVGRVSRFGLWPANEFQDSPGPIARSMADAAAILDVIAGPDEMDPLTKHAPPFKANSYIEACNDDALQGARLAVPRRSISASIQDEEIIDQFETTLDFLRTTGATIVDHTEYRSWRREWNSSTMSLVYGQLKKHMKIYLSSLAENPNDLRSLTDIIKATKGEPGEEHGAFGISVFEKAEATDLNDGETAALLAQRMAKGAEIDELLDENNCDVMIVPAQCHNPSDLGQRPVLCVPMGFFPRSHQIEKTNGDLVTKGPDIPFGMLFVGRKWDEARLIALGHAYEKASQEKRKMNDRPWLMPTAELEDILQQNSACDNHRL